MYSGVLFFLLITEVQDLQIPVRDLFGPVSKTHTVAGGWLRIPLSEVGFPIRKSADQSFFAAPRGLSQRSTSFIAYQRQGIHQMPLRHLIALIINAQPHSAWARYDFCKSQRRVTD